MLILRFVVGHQDANRLLHRASGNVME